MSDILRIDAEDAEVIAEAKDAAAEYANAKSYPDVMSAQERLRSMGAGAIPALLAENARLQRERAEWRDRADALMTEQMTQMRDLTAEVEGLRARLTLTPEKIEAAAKAAHGRWVLFYDEDVPWEDERESVQKLYRSSQRAALLAAGMTEEALQ